jgi:hypothetical protein
MVPSSTIVVATDGECLMYGGFSLDETVCLGNFEFITDYFSGLSLSWGRGDASAAFMGSTRSGAPTLQWAMMEDVAEGFLTASSEEGSFGLPSSRRCDTGASLTPVTTTPRLENASAAQATTMVNPRTVAPRLETDLPFERCHAHHGG